jgi:hypothetical protein
MRGDAGAGCHGAAGLPGASVESSPGPVRSAAALTIQWARNRSALLALSRGVPRGGRGPCEATRADRPPRAPALGDRRACAIGG